MELLKKNPTVDSYKGLIHITSAKIITFNKQRSGIAGRLLIEDYEKRPKNFKPTEEFNQTLSALEKQLAKVFEVVTIFNKRKGFVWLLLTPPVVKAIDLLLQFRKHHNIKASIQEENKFVFPVVSNRIKSLKSIRGDKCVTECVALCGLKRPELLSSRKMRKYTATVIQYMALPENQMSWVTKHLGHSLGVHLQHYRQHETALEITKISKMMFAVDHGCLLKFQNKTLDDITLEDIPLDNFLEEDNGTDDETDELNNLCEQNTEEVQTSDSARRGKRRPLLKATENIPDIPLDKVLEEETGKDDKTDELNNVCEQNTERKKFKPRIQHAGERGGPL
nr:PREDICTED: uncharacterized protein LOC109035682 [Bemisia tabaci]